MSYKEEPIDVIVPSLHPVHKLETLAAQLTKTAGHPHRLILACHDASAATNRNRGLALAKSPIVAMVDDDIEFYRDGWLFILINALQRPEVVMVSAQLLHPVRGFAYMTGLNDWGGKPKYDGETVVPTRRLLTACCAFKPLGCRFDENYVGSGFEDTDFCNQLVLAQPDSVFLVCHEAQVVHRNETKRQGGENWQINKSYYEHKWGYFQAPVLKAKERSERAKS